MTALRTTLLAAALLSAPAVAVAQTATTETPAATPAAPALPPAPAGSEAENDRIGAAKAIEAAKGRVDGGILEAELENDGGELIWEVDVVVGDTIQEVKVNAATGEVISADEKTIEGTWRGWFDEDRLAASQRLGGTLVEKLAAAEANLDGRITEMSLDEDDGKLRYELEVATADDDDRDMIFDPETGTITPDND